jgi:exopolyphosphatase/guanosine-5'-triphosphate,3'-diphosphate pyrophosphatase
MSLAHPLFGIIDIGSNTIRLVIYDCLNRSPLIVYTEKATCELARGIEKQGVIETERFILALANLERFGAIIDTMGVEHVKIVATSAVRSARNGPQFAKEAEAILGYPVNVISGEEEARLSAQGIIAGFTHPQGIIGDIGGGSLELAKVNGRRLSSFTSLNLGHQKLASVSENNQISFERLKEMIQAEVSEVKWLKRQTPSTFYAIGSGWRRLAEAHMKFSHYPLPVVHHYPLSAEELMRFIHFRKNFTTREDLLKNIGFSKKQIEAMAYSSLVLEAILEQGVFSEVIFSTNGLREGCVYELLSQEEREADPLIVSCQGIAMQSGGIPQNAQELLEWVLRLFPEATAEFKRLCHAVCLLSQISRVESRDFRSRNAFERVLYLPLTGITHAERVFLAMSLHARYSGDIQASYTEPFMELLHPEGMEYAQELGMAVRLAQSLCGETSGILMHTRLYVEGVDLVLEVPGDMPFWIGETVNKQHKALAEFLALKPKIQTTAEHFEIPHHPDPLYIP